MKVIGASIDPRVYTYNGKKLDICDFTDYYVKYMNMIADECAPGMPSGDVKYTFKSTLLLGQVFVLNLYERDENTYYTAIPDEPIEFVINKKSVIKVMDLLKTMIN